MLPMLLQPSFTFPRDASRASSPPSADVPTILEQLYQVKSFSAKINGES